jgi:hypothetical protein
MRIELKAFWETLYTSSFYPTFVEYFRLIFDIPAVCSKYDVVEIWSVFGSSPNSPSSQRTLRVQFTGESFYNPPDLYDINLICALPSQNNNIIPHTLAGLNIYVHNLYDKLKQPRVLNLDKKTRFCVFVVSNGAASERANFFKCLSEYKRVDSYGKFLNNCPGVTLPECDTDEYYDSLCSYKFMICFENARTNYYLTEKLINAYLSGCIPIYWGCPETDRLINPKSCLVLDPSASHNSMLELVEKVKILDNDPVAYKEMYEQPLFTSGYNGIPEEMKFEQLQSSVIKILQG